MWSKASCCCAGTHGGSAHEWCSASCSCDRDVLFMCDNTSALSASLHGCARSSGMGVLATHFTSLCVNTGCVCTRVRAAQVVDVDVHMCGAKRAVAVQVHMVDQRMSGAAQAVPVTEMSCSCVTTQARLVQACMVVRVRVAWAFSLHTSHLFGTCTSYSCACTRLWCSASW